MGNPSTDRRNLALTNAAKKRPKVKNLIKIIKDKRRVREWLSQ